MQRASPVDMRKALEMVNELRRAGILFVPVPVLDEADHARMVELAAQKLEMAARQSEESDGAAYARMSAKAASPELSEVVRGVADAIEGEKP